VPTLHRSDGGLGGFGRQNVNNNNNNNNSDTDSGDINSEGNRRMSEEESSLAMAREFLSRLLLMLACFVILCLLLF